MRKTTFDCLMLKHRPVYAVKAAPTEQKRPQRHAYYMVMHCDLTWGCFCSAGAAFKDVHLTRWPIHLE